MLVRKRLLATAFAAAARRWTHAAAGAAAAVGGGAGAAATASNAAPPTQSNQLQITTEHGMLQFHHVWLRDHCRCAECFHPVTQQRLVDTFQIPMTLQPRTAALTTDGRGVEIVWDNDGHKSVFDVDWLWQHAYSPQPKQEPDVFKQRRLWEAAELREHMPTVQYDKVMQSDAGVLDWLSRVAEWGLCLVKGVPPSPAATEELARRVSFIRETIFGGFWDFQPDLAHADTAYTSLALSAHTDTTYFTDPIGLQMFHLIEFDGVGGQTTLVDAFKVAELMKCDHPADYDAFCTIPVPTQYLDPKTHVDLRPLHRQPIFVRDPTHTGNSRDAPLVMVRYNNDDRAPLAGLQPSQVEAFYKAHRTFTKYIRDPRFEHTFQLTPGTVLLFDNHRLLHGRTAFTGHRRLIGCYLNGDDYRSRLRGLLDQQRSGQLLLNTVQAASQQHPPPSSMR